MLTINKSGRVRQPILCRDGTEEAIIRREFRHRGRRGICQILTDIQHKIRIGKSQHWKPSLGLIVAKCESAGITIDWLEENA